MTVRVCGLTALVFWTLVPFSLLNSRVICDNQQDRMTTTTRKHQGAAEMTRTTVSKWDARFMGLGRHVAGWSKDPSTKVGAVIVNDRLQVVGMGYNGFPRGTSDSGALYEDRERKYLRVVHAEVNAVLNATQSCMGATVYVTHPLGTNNGLEACIAYPDRAVNEHPWRVRRLSPVECERLQCFPDWYTNIPWRKRNDSPDGLRYKALGNSMAVNVMQWIGERIALVDALKEAA